MPLTNASPSLARSGSGSSPSRSNACSELSTSPSNRTWARSDVPVIALAIVESGTKSPLAPIEPSSRTTGTAWC